MVGTVVVVAGVVVAGVVAAVAGVVVPVRKNLSWSRKKNLNKTNVANCIELISLFELMMLYFKIK